MIRLEGISKQYGGVAALRDVTLDIAGGSCHALCGENGAGKSTLGKILAGIVSPDGGRILIDGVERRFSGPRDAAAAGIAIVHQELAFCDNLSVAENLCLGALPRRGPFVDRTALAERARRMLGEIGAELDVDQPVRLLPVAQQQVVQIAAAVGAGARIIVFDEPTSSLSEREATRFFDLLGRLKARGATCIYVSHRMPEVTRLCDTVSVLRDGQLVGTEPVAAVTEADVVRMMIGRPLGEYLGDEHASAAPGDEALRVDRLGVDGVFSDISFSLRGGEILGLAGLVGAGRSEVAAALFGLTPASRGEIRIDGRPARIRNPRQAMRLGIGLAPEDRKRQGIIPRESVLHNASLSILDRLSRKSWIDRRAERAAVGDQLGRLRVRASSVDAPVITLSGGNQQKVVLARCLAAAPKILILDEPTRGIDVGAKAEIHALVRDVAARGTAILLISSELPELLALSHRILVLRDGRPAGEVPRAEATEETLVCRMTGVA